MSKYYHSALQHDERGVVNFGAKPKIALTDVRSRVRESLAKILLSLYFCLLKLAYFLVKSFILQFRNLN